MSLVSLDTAKRHLRVLHDDADTEIGLYLDAAAIIVAEHIDRVIYETTAPTGDDGTAIQVNPAIQAAILLVMADLYWSREPDPKLVGDAVLPRTVRALLAPYRVWRTVGEEE